jgi:hypothetical protein
MGEQSPDDAVHRRRRQVEALGDLAETEAMVSLEDRKDAQRAIDRLNHGDISVAEGLAHRETSA